MLCAVDLPICQPSDQRIAVLDVLRRELRRVSPEVRIDIDQIKQVLADEVIKRDVMEGDKAEEAQRKLGRAAGKALRSAREPKPVDVPDEKTARDNAAIQGG